MDILITDEFTTLDNSNELQNSVFLLKLFDLTKSLSVQVTNRKGYVRNSEFWKPFLTSKGIEGIYITLN